MLLINSAITAWQNILVVRMQTRTGCACTTHIVHMTGVLSIGRIYFLGLIGPPLLVLHLSYLQPNKH